MADPQTITLEDIESAQIAFPEAFPGVRKGRMSQDTVVIIESGPLTEEHIALQAAHDEAGATFQPQGVYDIKRIRASHQRMAQLMAMGIPDTRICLLCNISTTRLWQVKQSPAFKNLLDSYAGIQQEEFADFVAAAADMSMDLLEHLSSLLQDCPEKFTPSVTNDLLKTISDRAGHAPVTKSLNVNINANMGDRLKAARERAAQLALDALRDTT